MGSTVQVRLEVRKDLEEIVRRRVKGDRSHYSIDKWLVFLYCECCFVFELLLNTLNIINSKINKQTQVLVKIQIAVES